MTTQKAEHPKEGFPDNLTADAWEYDHEAYLQAHWDRIAAKQAEEETKRRLDQDRLTIATGALKGKTITMARDARNCITIITAFAEDTGQPQDAKESVLEAAEKLSQALALINEATPLLEPAKALSKQIFERNVRNTRR